MKKIPVKAIRVSAGYTQEEFAKAINMPLPTYIKKEQGQTEFYFSEIVEICELTGFDLRQVKPKED